MRTACHPPLLLIPALLLGSAPCGATESATYAPAPFSAYQPILDRMPFGPMAAAPLEQAVDPALAQTEAQAEAEKDKLSDLINLSCINITPDGAVAVGFTDTSAKPPIYYYLRVGESSSGWAVLAADYDEEWADIEKDGVSVRRKLGVKERINAAPADAAAAAAPGSLAASMPPPPHAALAIPPAPLAASPEAQPSGPRVGSILRPSKGGVPSLVPSSLAGVKASEMVQLRDEVNKLKESGGDVKSYMQRYQERKAQEKAEKAATEEAARKQLQQMARKITEDELRKREREMNLNLIEQGANPISDIELTPEEEARLIERGVLAQ